MKLSKVLPLTFFALLIGFSATAQFNSLMKKANKEYELHAFNQAIETYKEALERRPDDPEALGNMADCYRHLNDMMEAAKYYARSIAQKKVEARHILNYAHVLKGLGQYDEARRWYLEYAKDDPLVGNHYAETCNFAKNQQKVNTGLLVQNENEVNSPAADFGPTFVRGQIVFSSARIDVQSSNTNYTGEQPNQLYVAKAGADGLLENAYLVGNSSGQTDNNKGPISVSPDGKLIAYTKNNFINGTRHIPSSGMQLSLFIAEINPNGTWVNEQPFPYNGVDFSTGFPCFSADGNSLYFASDRPDGFGGYDIYVSDRIGNTWERPENLGPVVNTPGHELTPYHDGENLFFASDWHPGFGGFDIYRVIRANNRWNQIFHIGNPVSSPRDDYGLIYDKDRNQGYFVSNRDGGQGMEDLYAVSRPAESVVLNVRNASSGEPVPNALIDLTGCDMSLVQADDRGVYRLQALEGLNCDVIIRKDGYVDQTIKMTSEAKQGTRQIDVQLIRRGEEYYGKILNYNTRLPVEGVTVIATNQATNSETKAMTDPNGDYTLALSPNSTYSIRYSRQGYREVSRRISTTATTNPAILGSTPILPSDSPLPPGVTDPNQLIDPYGTASPSQPAAAPGPQMASGFAVQVAALSKVDMARFNNLKSFGEVYSKPAGAVSKIRVGVYPTKEEASQKLLQVKQAGYPQAFVVAEEGVELGGGVGAPQFTGNQSAGAAGGGNYFIQLGAFSNPRNFDASPLNGLGTVIDVPKGNLTVKLLASFTTAADAKGVLPAVQSKGFPKAYIVMRDANGNWQRVQ